MPLRVLVVDDDEQSLATLRDMILQGMPGTDVQTARSAVQALAMVQQERPDALVTDYKMPRMDGLRLAQELHRSTPRLPLVLVSGYVDGTLREVVGMSNIRAVLQKPVTRKILVATVRQALDDSIGPAPS